MLKNLLTSLHYVGYYLHIVEKQNVFQHRACEKNLKFSSRLTETGNIKIK